MRRSSVKAVGLSCSRASSWIKGRDSQNVLARHAYFVQTLGGSQEDVPEACCIIQETMDLTHHNALPKYYYYDV